jgi:hypothetical protein
MPEQGFSALEAELHAVGNLMIRAPAGPPEIVAMTLSIFALEKMGFKEISQDNPISGIFYAIHSFEIRGFTIEEKVLDPHAGMLDGTPYRFAVGSSINDICRSLVGEDLTLILRRALSACFAPTRRPPRLVRPDREERLFLCFRWTLARPW